MNVADRCCIDDTKKIQIVHSTALMFEDEEINNDYGIVLKE